MSPFATVLEYGYGNHQRSRLITLKQYDNGIDLLLQKPLRCSSGIGNTNYEGVKLIAKKTPKTKAFGVSTNFLYVIFTCQEQP